MDGGRRVHGYFVIDRMSACKMRQCCGDQGLKVPDNKPGHHIRDALVKWWDFYVLL
jgi:hypothetical protein